MLEVVDWTQIEHMKSIGWMQKHKWFCKTQKKSVAANWKKSATEIWNDVNKQIRHVIETPSKCINFYDKVYKYRIYCLVDF